MKLKFNNIFQHLLVLAFFAGFAIFFFHPVIQGKSIYQSDIEQYRGMAKERNDFRTETKIESFWTNSAFGGMPTYQLGAEYPHNYIKQLDRWIRFLPRPADYLFLYLLGFYILMIAIPVDWRVAVVASLGFGLSTYFIIILGVGHNAKAHAIAYLPIVLGGILLVFRKKYILGFIATCLGMALEVNANHFQMTYYFMLLVLIFGLVKLVDAIIKKELLHFSKSVGILLLAVMIGIACNATNLLATQEYAQWSTRGKSEITINLDGTPKENKEGLSFEYITQYSYGITESLNLIFPRLFGGSNSENLGKESKTFEFLTSQGIPSGRALEFSESLPLYWGDQFATAGPAYIGAIVVFLALLGFFILPTTTRIWIGLTVFFILLLSWGKNLAPISAFMIDHFPLYNKFRAVSSIQVIVELCLPLLAFMALNKIIREENKKKLLNPLYTAAGILAVLGLGLLIFKGEFSFEGFRDTTLEQYYGPELMEIIKSDRKAVFTSDILRSLGLILGVGILIVLYLRSMIKSTSMIIAVGLLVVLDLWGVAKRYVDENDFVSKRKLETPFVATDVDKLILQDEGYFRVLNLDEGLNGSRTSYFHKSLGGYHAAKPRKIEELFDFHIYQNNTEVLNMLNVKYVIQRGEEGSAYPALNDEANGNLWLIESLNAVPNANEEILALKDVNTKKTAVFNQSKYPKLKAQYFIVDSLASLKLTRYAPNKLRYEVNSKNDGFVVFSDMYYPSGWVSTINGKITPHYQVNFALRGMPITKGQHEIVFEFKPEVVNQGSKIALASQGILAIIIIAGLLLGLKNSKYKA